VGAKIITDPHNGFAPAGTIVSSLRALQRMGAKAWSGRCLDSSMVLTSEVLQQIENMDVK